MKQALTLLAVTLALVALATPTVDGRTPRAVEAKAVDAANTFGVVGGVEIGGDGFGSSLAPVPGRPGELYGLSDRGPNVEGPQSDSKIFPLPQYQPAIARMRLRGGVAEIVATIRLRDERGRPFCGLVPPSQLGATGEVAFDLQGRTLEPAANGIDPEGLVALADGTFWVAEEYLPSLMHFGRDGRLLERVTPVAPNARGHRLPPELARRIPNRGIEALTVTPDGRTLVFMQNAVANDVTVAEAKATSAARLVAYVPSTGAVHTYLYLLDDPVTLSTMTSEIAALSATEFLVVEHDVHFTGSGSKRKAIFEISIRDATDVARATGDAGRLDPARGLLVDGETIERVVAKLPTADAIARLAQVGIRPVTKRLRFDLNTLFLASDPNGRFFAHDKIEGLAVIDHGRRFVLSNDSDFGIGPTSPPSLGVAQKIVPATGRRDFGELLILDLPASRP